MSEDRETVRRFPLLRTPGQRSHSETVRHILSQLPLHSVTCALLIEFAGFTRLNKGRAGFAGQTAPAGAGSVTGTWLDAT